MGFVIVSVLAGQWAGMAAGKASAEKNASAEPAPAGEATGTGRASVPQPQAAGPA
jgi:hypothetical protein